MENKNSIIIEIGDVENVCFVAMPFDSLFQAYYEQVIRPAVEELGLKCIRGDEIYSRPQIMADIWNSIRKARLVIAELTNKNPNVFYEVGLAHAIGKPLILLTRNENDVPFDLKALRYRYYDVNDPRWGDNLRKAIQSMVQSVLEQSGLSTYLEGIKSTVYFPAPPKGEKAASSEKPYLDISGAWEGSFTVISERYNLNTDYDGIMYITQEQEKITATFESKHFHHKVETIVREELIGTVQGTLVNLSGVSYTYIEQGECDKYALKSFELVLNTNGRKMTGRITSEIGEGITTFIKVR